jgi:hypothetical protein
VNPWQFLKDFVEPAVAEWHADPLNIRRATIALAELDNLAEHFILYTQPGLLQIAPERDALGLSVPLAAIARDVHDTHKHGPLRRKSATMKQGQRPQQSLRGGEFSDEFSAEFNIGVPTIVIVQDDGTKYFADDVIYPLMRHWHNELSKHVR